MKAYIFILLVPFLLCFSGKAVSQVEQEEEVIISKPDVDSADINTFYDSLSKEGEWIKVDNDEIDNDEDLQMSETVEIDNDVITGYIWRPSVSITLVDWSPYTYGHWEFCTFGWIWVSDYYWGWGPYHYGRWWFSHRWGWVWSPGHRWAPSWVSWCHTRNHVGWHPISPRTPWRYHNGVLVTHPITPKQKGITNKWTFVNKSDFTKTITKNNTIDIKNNKQILADAKLTMKSNEVYNNGPKKNDIESNTGSKVDRKNVSFTNTNGKPIKDKESQKYARTNENISGQNNGNRSSDRTKKDNGNYNKTSRKNNGNKNGNRNNNNGTRNDEGNKKTRSYDNNMNYKSGNSNSNRNSGNSYGNHSRNSNSNNSSRNNNGYGSHHSNSGNNNSSHNSSNSSSRSSNNSGNRSSNSNSSKK